MMKKSKWLSIIAVILVIACMATLLVGCNDKEKPVEPDPDDGETTTVDVNEVFDKVIAGYAKTIGDDAAASAFNFETALKVYAQEGTEAKKEYTINFKLGLDMVSSVENGAAQNGLYIDIKEGNNTVFNFNYKNDYEGAYAAYNDKVYMQVGDKKFNIQAVDVAKTIQEQFAKANIQINPEPSGQDKDGNDVYDCNPILDDEIAAFVESIGEYIKMAAIAVDAETATLSDNACSFEINLGTLLDPTSSVGSIIAAFQGTAAPYLDALGIDLNLGALNTVLPALAIKFDFAFDSTGKVTNAKADIVIPAKHIQIAHKNASTNLIDINIPNELKAGVEVTTLKVNDANFTLPNGAFSAECKKIKAIDLSLGGEIKVNKSINMDIAGVVSLNIPAGTYALTAEVSIDPTALLGVDFVDAGGNFAIGNLLDALLGSETKSAAIDFIDLSLVNTADKTTLLVAKLDTTANKVYAELGAVGMGTLAYNDLSAFKSFITGLIGGGEEEATADGDVDTSALEPYGKAIKNLQIVVNEDGVSVTFANTKFNLGYTNEETGEIEYDEEVFHLEVGASATINSDGITIKALVKNGGTLVAESGSFEIDVEVKLTTFTYGTAVRPTFE
ncbi:MAG: hypothetical protein ACI4MI_02450 [Christensenellales bacterium]